MLYESLLHRLELLLDVVAEHAYERLDPTHWFRRRLDEGVARLRQTSLAPGPASDHLDLQVFGLQAAMVVETMAPHLDGRASVFAEGYLEGVRQSVTRLDERKAPPAPPAA